MERSERRVVAPTVGGGEEARGARPADGSTTEARSAAYALFSRLVASPVRPSGGETLLPPSDLAAVAALLEEELPYALDLSPLVDAASRLGPDEAVELEAAYSALFEVGSDGPPVPLREELAAGRPTRSKEEVVRFYDYFGYELLEERRWAPDHLAIELEFLHLLSFKEAAAAGSGDEEWLSFRLAQLDFLERHPLDWIDQVSAGVAASAGEPYHRLLFETLERFLEHDHRWLSEMSEAR